MSRQTADNGQVKPAENTVKIMLKDGLEPDIVSYCLVAQAAVRAREEARVEANMALVRELVAAKARGHASPIVALTEGMVRRFSSLSKSAGEPPHEAYD